LVHCSTVQDGERSWAAVKRWHLIFESPLSVDDTLLASLRPGVIKDLCEHYHHEDGYGIATELDPDEYEDCSAKAINSLFIAILRRCGGGDIRNDTDAIRDKVAREMNRVKWQKNAPELMPW
jgi:hypothetical protein